MNNEEMFSRFIYEYEQLDKETKRKYQIYLRQFFSFCMKTYADVTRHDIQSWLNRLNTNGNKPATRNNKLSALKTFFRFLHEDEYILKNPTEDIEFIKIKERLPLYLDKVTLAQLLEISNRSKLERAIVETLDATGVRIGELLNIEKNDVKWEQRQIVIKDTKGDRDRFVLFTPSCEARLKEYLKSRKVESNYLFCRKDGKPLHPNWVRTRFEEYSKQVNNPFKITPHTMRRTFAAHLAEKGMPLAYIQKLLGHIDMNSTRIYAKLYNEARKKRYDYYH